jgi:hypothetical protein
MATFASSIPSPLHVNLSPLFWLLFLNMLCCVVLHYVTLCYVTLCYVMYLFSLYQLISLHKLDSAKCLLAIFTCSNLMYVSYHFFLVSILNQYCSTNNLSCLSC